MNRCWCWSGVEGVGILGVQVAWCSRNGSCGGPVVAASSLQGFGPSGSVDLAAQLPSATVHMLLGQ